MATIKTKFRPSIVAGNEGTIYYQVIHNRRVRHISTELHVFPGEWNEEKSVVRFDRADKRAAIIDFVRSQISIDRYRLSRIAEGFESESIDYSVDDIINEYYRQLKVYTLFCFMEDVIATLRAKGNTRTAEAYSSALSSFRRFRNGKDVMLDAVTSDLMEEFELWLGKRGVRRNTVSFYMRILRAVYNRTVEKEIIENQQPFRHVYTGIDRTAKRALPLETIRRIKALDLNNDAPANYARDMFMLSFYLRGMSFIDMAYLKKSDLCNDQIRYFRSKTGQRLVIGWTEEMQQIIDKYPKNTTDYLLPIILTSGVDERVVYHNTGYRINYHLKKIGVKIGLSESLTLYVARHSWASAAKAKGIPVGVISEGMGHGSEKTTRIYLSELDTSVVDDANRVIISSL